ncbi:Uncharacterised protein [Helicobacter cinaedi]|uniref:Uncharacterized protein n=1 Tax=Helicobacter cinaedi TaxID=213 RepID=A0A377JXF3_9HELI|nr:hypothetical protein [Helicobacter cinaedi]STP14305.1 Uncharacterised protein [Helicobacter cinaedi]
MKIFIFKGGSGDTKQAEIKAYYETHNTKAKEVAKIFNIAYRTLANWIAKEGWEKGAAIKEIEAEVLNKSHKPPLKHISRQ